jgi:AraC-like DNA-binding protein
MLLALASAKGHSATAPQREPEQQGPHMFREVRPSPPLRGVVDRFWQCDDALAFTSVDPFEVLPDGCVEVVFAMGESRGQVLVFGTATKGGFFSTQPGTVYLGMRLRPARLSGLIDARADSLNDRRDELDHLGELRADDLLAQLHEAASVEAQVAVLEQHVHQAWRAQARLAGVDRVVAAVHRHAGDIRVEQLVEHAGLSRRQLERQFRDAVGLTPKQFCRVVRFQHALARLRDGHLNRAALAAELGFTDQSHLRRDFMALANRAFAAE